MFRADGVLCKLQVSIRGKSGAVTHSRLYARGSRQAADSGMTQGAASLAKQCDLLRLKGGGALGQLARQPIG